MAQLMALFMAISSFFPGSLAEVKTTKRRSVNPCPITRVVDRGAGTTCQAGHYEDCNGRITGYWAFCD